MNRAKRAAPLDPPESWGPARCRGESRRGGSRRTTLLLIVATALGPGPAAAREALSAPIHDTRLPAVRPGTSCSPGRKTALSRGKGVDGGSRRAGKAAESRESSPVARSSTLNSRLPARTYSTVAVKTSSIRKGRRHPVAGSSWRRLSVQMGWDTPPWETSPS
jgi:hypothetical protein